MSKQIESIEVLTSPYKGVDIEVREKLLSTFALELSTLDPEEYITYRVALALVGEAPTGATKISIPSASYPDATLTDDGFTVTFMFGDTIKGLLAGFEPVAFLIQDGQVSGTAPRYIYDGSNFVTGMFWDGAYVPSSVTKVNLIA